MRTTTRRRTTTKRALRRLIEQRSTGAETLSPRHLSAQRHLHCVQRHLARGPDGFVRLMPWAVASRSARDGRCRLYIFIPSYGKLHLLVIYKFRLELRK